MPQARGGGRKKRQWVLVFVAVPPGSPRAWAGKMGRNVIRIDGSLGGGRAGEREWESGLTGLMMLKGRKREQRWVWACCVPPGRAGWLMGAWRFGRIARRQGSGPCLLCCASHSMLIIPLLCLFGACQRAAAGMIGWWSALDGQRHSRVQQAKQVEEEEKAVHSRPRLWRACVRVLLPQDVRRRALALHWNRCEGRWRNRWAVGLAAIGLTSVPARSQGG